MAKFWLSSATADSVGESNSSLRPAPTEFPLASATDRGTGLACADADYGVDAVGAGTDRNPTGDAEDAERGEVAEKLT